MQIVIETLSGTIITVELAEVEGCYPDDDVIYFHGEPCKLSSARPAFVEDVSQ